MSGATMAPAPGAANPRRELGRRDWLVAAAIALAATLCAYFSSPAQGVHRDEAIYMEAGEQYVTYWEHVLRGELDGRVTGAHRLHRDLPLQFTATSATGDLRQELEGALCRAEVGQVERTVGRDDADHRHVREVEPLGDHLRTQQDLHLTGPEPV